MTIQRIIEQDVLHAATQYPVVAVLGPRQSGKTTLVKTIFHDRPYRNLEHPEIRQLAQQDPQGFLSELPHGGVIDEIQHAPALLSYLQVIVDEHQQPGEFIITGNQQFALNQAITQSLAGRVDIVTLLPLSLREIHETRPNCTTQDALFQGGYPKLYSQPLNPTRYYRNYVSTYVERDVRSLLNVTDLNKFQHFLVLCAGRIGQLLNASDLAGALGVSSHTINAWLSVLEASFITFRLSPYFANIGKRLTKAPKLYFYDVGLATYLLGITHPGQLPRDPAYGHLFENLVVTELLKQDYNQGQKPNLFFYRDSAGHEVDILRVNGQNIAAFEVKSAQTFHPEFVKQLGYLQDMLGNQLTQQSVIYNGKRHTTFHDIVVANVWCFLS